MSLKIHLNGREVSVDVGPERDLLSVLRDDLELTGSKYGCGEGACGACTVLVDGKATRSCQTEFGKLGEGKITTIEGLVENGELHPVQQAFLDADAFQCGYCTCGMILSAVALLDRHPDPSDDEINEGMDGNICRCGGYNNVRAAIRLAAETLRRQTK